MKAVLGVITVLATLVLLAVIGWQFGWWLKEKDVDRQVNIDNRNTGTQTAWHDEATNLITEASLLPENHPSRPALERQACELIGRLTDPYMDDNLEAFQGEVCL